MTDSRITLFEHLMRTVYAPPTLDPIEIGGRVLVYTPKPIPPLEVKWDFPRHRPDWWMMAGGHRPAYRPQVIKIVWPKPRRMRCGKWRAAGKVYRTKALAWRGLEKRGLRP